MFKKNGLLFIVLFICGISNAQVTPNTIFADHMVLQRNQPIAVFGKAETEKKITLTFKNKTYSAKVKDGSWKVFLDESEAGGPFILSIEGKNKIVLSDILIGEVWLCSGQSNMELSLKGNPGQPIFGSNLAILKSKNNNLRFFKVEKKVSDVPLNDCNGNWELSSPETVSDFSATAYFFGKLLQETLNVPVGLINSSWGATPAEAWTPKETTDKEFRGFKDWYNVKKQPQKSPNGLYNGMIHPLIPYSIKGTIWYQGEANKVRAKQYVQLFPAMIKSWRTLWKQGDFPFYFVQIAPLGWGGENQQLLREAQLKTMLTVPNTGMAVTLDIGEKDNIHPGEKQKVGERLALWALAKDYGFTKIEYNGPIYKSMKVDGNKVSLHFDYAKLGLSTFGKKLSDFVIAGEDKVFYKAEAKITKGKLKVWSDKVSKPIAVRYGWSEWVNGSLYNTAGLPASSFRTDDW